MSHEFMQTLLLFDLNNKRRTVYTVHNHTTLYHTYIQIHIDLIMCYVAIVDGSRIQSLTAESCICVCIYEI